jgi:hypothetical protein
MKRIQYCPKIKMVEKSSQDVFSSSAIQTFAEKEEQHTKPRAFHFRPVFYLKIPWQ